MTLRFAASLMLLCAVPVAAQPPTMAQLWPNDDGRNWRYNQHYEDYLSNPLDNQLRLFFDGTTTAPDGIATQYLHQELLSGLSTVMPLAGAPEAVSRRGPLLRAVWMSRPDLRARIEQVAAESPCPENAPSGGYAILLGGEFAWVRTATDITAWRCNVANTRAWQWLDSNLSIGHTFTLRLVPDLANDVFLHGTVAAVESAIVPAGVFDNCVRVDYVIDYGADNCDETRGWVRYAPDVGPVQSFEQYIQNEGCTVDEPLSLTTMKLNSLPVPARPMSWGKLKVAYR